MQNNKNNELRWKRRDRLSCLLLYGGILLMLTIQAIYYYLKFFK